MTHRDLLLPLLALGTALSFAACGGASAADGTSTTTASDTSAHAIVIHRPWSAGQRVEVEVEAHEIVEAVESTEAGGAMAIEDFTVNTQVTLAGVFTVSEVDNEGRVASAELEVTRFVTSEGAEVLPAGTRLIANVAGEELSVEVDGEAPSDEIIELLRLAFPLERPGSPLGDALFGTETPKAIGESWDVNRSEVAEDLSEDGYTTTEATITGRTELVGKSACGAGECLVLEANINAEEVTIAEDWEIAEFDAGELEAVVRLTLPTDAALPVFREEAVTTGRFIARVTVDGEIDEITATVSRMRNATYTLAL